MRAISEAAARRERLSFQPLEPNPDLVPTVRGKPGPPPPPRPLAPPQADAPTSYMSVLLTWVALVEGTAIVLAGLVLSLLP